MHTSLGGGGGGEPPTSRIPKPSPLPMRRSLSLRLRSDDDDDDDNVDTVDGAAVVAIGKPYNCVPEEAGNDGDYADVFGTVAKSAAFDAAAVTSASCAALNTTTNTTQPKPTSNRGCCTTTTATTPPATLTNSKSLTSIAGSPTMAHNCSNGGGAIGASCSGKKEQSAHSNGSAGKSHKHQHGMVSMIRVCVCCGNKHCAK